MKIVILNPPSRDEGYINRDEMGGMGQKIKFDKNIISTLLARLKSNMIHLPVMNLVYAATILNLKHDVKVIDAQNDDLSEKEVLKRIEQFNPNRVLMAVSSYDICYEKELAGSIKEQTGAWIQTIGDTLTYSELKNKTPFDHHIEESAEKFFMRTILQSGTMLELPAPKWDLFNYKKYRLYPLISKRPVVPVIASRGCPYNCSYCSYTKNQGMEWKPVPLNHLQQEILTNKNKYGFKGIAFRDPLFSFDRKRTIEICNMLKPLEMEWICETRPELLDMDLLDEMAKSGCIGIEMGIESTDETILKNVNRKSYSLKKIKKIVAYAEAIGIRTVLFFILGLPGETKKTIEKTINFAIEANPSHAEFKIATPYPGTKLYDLAKKNNWIINDSFGGYSATMQINKDLPPEYLEQKSSEAFKRFYFRKDYILKELKKKNLVKKSMMIMRSII